MATQSLLTLRSTPILSSGFSSVVAVSTGNRTTGDLNSTEQRRMQADPIDLPRLRGSCLAQRHETEVPEP